MSHADLHLRHEVICTNIEGEFIFFYFRVKMYPNIAYNIRSRAHAMRLQGGEPQPEDEASLGSDPDQDLSSSASSDVVSTLYRFLFALLQIFNLNMKIYKQFSRTASPMDDRVSSPSGQPQNQTMAIEKPYKPKFHSASLYTKDEQQQQQVTKQQQRQPQPSTVPLIIPAQFSAVPSSSTSNATNISHPLVS